MATALGVVFELEGICSQSLQQVTPAAGCTVILEKKKQTRDRKQSPGWLKRTGPWKLGGLREEVSNIQVY